MASQGFIKGILFGSGLPIILISSAYFISSIHNQIYAKTDAITKTAPYPPTYPSHVAGEFLIKLKPNTDFNDWKIKTSKTVKYQHISKLYLPQSEHQFVKVTLDDTREKPLKIISQLGQKAQLPSEIETQIHNLSQDDQVVTVEPNYLYSTNLTPNDPLFPNQWYLPNISAEAGWEHGVGSSPVTIAVLDTGIDINHEDLQPNIWINRAEIPQDGIDNDLNGFVDDVNGWDFVATDPTLCASGEDCLIPDNNPSDFVGHGTHVAGIIGALGNNQIGIAGICWQCTIMPIRAGYLGSDHNGYLDTETIIEGLYYAADNGAQIINMSFGSQFYSSILDAALKELAAQNIILIASAGNYSSDYHTYPASLNQVIAVAATDSNNHRTNFSSYGSWVDIAAPGERILSLRAPGTDMYQDPNHVVADQYYLASGTSMSSPIIAGVVALRLSHTPNLDQIQLMKLLKNAHDPPISNEPIGFGKVNLLQWLIQSPSISQVQLTNPQENNYLFTPIQPSLSIYGTGQQVTNYRLEYSQGLYPTSWQTIIDSDQPLNSSNPQLLTTWTPQVSPDQSYTLRFTGFDQSNNPDVALTRLSFYDPNLGWMTNLGSPYISSPVTGDLNADGQSEIIVVNTPTAFSNDLNLNIFNADGTSFLPSLPLRIQGGYGGFGSTPAIGDINQDNHQEIILAGTNKFEYPFQEEGTLTIISDLGIPLPGWDPKTIDDGISLDSRWCRGWQHPDRHCGGFQSAPVLADLDKDGNLDIIILSNFGKLYVFHGDGSSLSPFPLLLGQPYWFGNTHNSPAVGDLNQDGNLEIVVALGENNVPEAGTYIYVIDHTGTVQPGWPKIIIGDDPSQATYYSSINAPPILVDIDQDHKLEIFVLSWNEQGGLIHGWNEDGSNIPGWPVSVPGAMYSLSAGRFSNFTSPVIFAATYRPDFPQKVFAFAPEGQPLPNWPLNTSINAMTGQAILGNFDTDSDQEVFFNSGITNQGIAYNYDGSLAEGWPKNIRTSSWRTPTLIYPEMNRSLIVIADTNSGFLQAFELPLLQIMQSSWGTFQQNTFHTGVLPGRLSYTLVDLDNDGDTDILDYFIFQPLYGDIENHGDINQDGLTNLYDFNLLIQP